jgi:hypothetical protein
MITIKSEELELTTHTVAVSEIGKPPHGLAIKHPAGIDFVDNVTFQEYSRSLTEATHRDNIHPIVDLRSVQAAKPPTPEPSGQIRQTRQNLDQARARALFNPHL